MHHSWGIKKRRIDMILYIFRQVAKTNLKYLNAGIILISLCLPIACEKHKPIALVLFEIPGSYSGTYLMVRDYMTPTETECQAHVTFDFRSDNIFSMNVNSNAENNSLNLCSVRGTYIFIGASLTLNVADSNLYQKVCDPKEGPQGVFKQRTFENIFIFINSGTTYRKIELVGN